MVRCHKVYFIYFIFFIVEFHPKLIGLTGNADEIQKVARAYRVYYMKTEEEGSDYLVDHSIVMYVQLLPLEMPFCVFISCLLLTHAENLSFNFREHEPFFIFIEKD